MRNVVAPGMCAVLAGLLSIAHADESLNRGTLFWGNGDSLNGQLVSAENQVLTWKSPLFAEPLQVELSVLSSVRFPELESKPHSAERDEFQVTLVDNNVLHGQLVSIADKTITMKSDRHGQMMLNRDSIRSLQRSRSEGLLFLGPRGLDDWKVAKKHEAALDWTVKDDGSLFHPRGESSLLQTFDFPELCEMEFEVQASRLPDFLIGLGHHSGMAFRLEMWGDSFIARTGAEQFVELQTVTNEIRSMRFQLFIDFRKSFLAVYSHSGRKLGQLHGENWKAGKQQLKVEAVDSDLTLKHLRIGAWDGSVPPELVPGRSRVHLQNGTVHYGTLQDFSGDTKTLQFAVQDPESSGQTPAKEGEAPAALDSEEKPPAEERPKGDARIAPSADSPDASDNIIQIPLADIATLVLSTNESRNRDQAKTAVSWSNGAFLSGQMVSMNHDSITLKTDNSKQPITSALGGVRRIGFPNTVKPEEQPDQLFFEGGSLRGSLTVEDHASPIRWKPVGGLNASALISGGQARFQRGAEPEQIAIDSTQFPDVAYLHDGDAFPCRVKSGNSDSFQIVTPLSDIRQIDASLVKAIEFGNSHRARQVGFADPQWRRLQGNVTNHDGQAIAFSAGNPMYGHPSILTGDAISFRLRWKPSCYGSVTLDLYTPSSLPENSPSSAVVNIGLQQNMVLISDRRPNQNGRRAGFGFQRGGADNGAVRVSDQTAQIQIVVRDGQLHVTVNGEEAKSIDLQDVSAGGQGLIISSSITSVNSRNSRSLKDTLRGMIEINNLLVRNIVGSSVKQFIQEEARDRALLVPRFRRDDPPTHVLLSPTGDLLRGRLEEITDSEVVFESRLETFRFPRKRVAAVIAVTPADADETAAKRAPTAVQARLDNGYTLTMTPHSMSNGQLVGSSQQLGECRIPAMAIRDLFLGAPDNAQGIMSYVRWIRTDAKEPAWENAEDDQGAEHETLGRTIEPFELLTLDGGLFKLVEHEHKIVVLDFWATWCGPCVAALPEYIAATSEFDPAEVIFVAVNLEEAPERIQEFLKRNNLAPTVALDRGSVIARRFGVSGIPHSVILGPGRVIKHVTVGYQKGTGEKTRERIQQLLDER